MDQELLRLASSSPVDLLCAPVPSCLPSPQLRPDPVILQSTDLIQFEERPQEPSGRLHCLRGLSLWIKISKNHDASVLNVGGR